MTDEEFKLKVLKAKAQAFDLVVIGSRMEPSVLGYKTHEEMALKSILETNKGIQADLLRFEAQKRR